MIRLILNIFVFHFCLLCSQRLVKCLCDPLTPPRRPIRQWALLLYSGPVLSILGKITACSLAMFQMELPVPAGAGSAVLLYENVFIWTS